MSDRSFGINCLEPSLGKELKVPLILEQVPEETTDKDGKKTWKGKVAKQWKKIQGTPPLPLAPYPEGGSIGNESFLITSNLHTLILGAFFIYYLKQMLFI